MNHESSNKPKAHDQGYDHYESGGTINDNPFSIHSSSYHDWKNGFLDAKNADRESYSPESFSDLSDH